MERWSEVSEKENLLGVFFSFFFSYAKTNVINRYDKSYYLPTPPLGQDMTQGQFLSGV